MGGETPPYVHAANFEGMVLHFVNYLDEFPYFAREVLPRLERMGLRMPAVRNIA